MSQVIIGKLSQGSFVDDEMHFAVKFPSENFF